MIIPRPTYTEPEERAEVRVGVSESESERIRRYLDVPNWTCPKCEAVMFGRVKACVYCREALKTHTPRPSTYLFD